MPKHPSPPRRCALALALWLAAAPALAQTPADDRRELEQLRATTLALIEALVAQGLLTRERADALLRQAQAGRADGAAAATPQWGAPLPPAGTAAPVAGERVIRVPYLSETARTQMREEVKNEVLAVAREERWADPGTLPAWVRSLTFEGDVRVRYQAERYDPPVYQTDPNTGQPIGGPCDIVGGNLPAECFRAQTTAGASPAWAPDVNNTTIDRDRLTLRARLGVTAKVSDDTSAGIRITTGTASGPTSSSQTLDGYFNKAGIFLDRAFVRWEPRNDMRFVGGRFANPFFSSDLLWPDDLNFDGLAAQGEINLDTGLYAFGTLGAFPLSEFSVDSRDKWLYGLQLGANWTLARDAQLRVGLAVYDFDNVEGVRETDPPPSDPRLGTVPYLTSLYPPTVRLKGNTLININYPQSTAGATWGLASRFRPINLHAQLTMRPLAPYEWQLGIDWLRNTAFDLDDVRRRSGLPTLDLKDQTTGLQLRSRFGTPQLGERGDWNFLLALRRFERDAWIDGFTDTTWHLGGTNYQGWQLIGNYAFDRRTWLSLRVTSTRNLDDGVRYTVGDPPVTTGNLSSAPLKIDVLQLEVNTRF
jgi:hypothetical protein